MSTLANDIKEAVEAFYKTNTNDDEHDAALKMADLLVGIATTHDPDIVIQDYYGDDEELDVCCDHGAEAGPAYERSLAACTCECHV